jgi:hypothetical protein
VGADDNSIDLVAFFDLAFGACDLYRSGNYIAQTRPAAMVFARHSENCDFFRAGVVCNF